MGSSINIFNTGKSGLFANRAALATTGHNIANVNTEGYSRQRVDTTTQHPSGIGKHVYGTGTTISQINRINDEYLTRQVSNEMKYLGEYEEKDMALAQAESVFNEIGNAGLNRLVSKLFNEFRKLGNEPESEALRATVRESADQLIGDFKRISRSVRDVQKNIDVRIDANVRQVNEYIDKIAQLNDDIKRIELSGGQSGDLRDARDLAVKKFATITDLSVSTNEKGDFSLSIKGIGTVVAGLLKSKLYVETGKADPQIGRPEGALRVFMQNRVPPEITDNLKHGRLGGLIETRDKLLGVAMARIDELAYSLATKINEVHTLGFTLNGSSGINFFKQPKAMAQAAELMALSTEVQADSKNIATAITPDAPGDNRLVQYIAKLQHAKIMSGGQSTFDDHYNATVADLATVTAKNKQVFEHQQHIVGQLEKFRDSVSGVSLDEETTNLVQYQHAFDASAKVIKVADEMLQTILDLKR